jgi:hypothetical protein
MEANNSNSEEKDKKSVAYYFDFKEVLNYYFRKKDPNRPSNINLKMMHGVNKITILMFLFCLIVMITRAIMRS